MISPIKNNTVSGKLEHCAALCLVSLVESCDPDVVKSMISYISDLCEVLSANEHAAVCVVNCLRCLASTGQSEVLAALKGKMDVLSYISGKNIFAGTGAGSAPR